MPTLLENGTAITPFEEQKNAAILIDDNGFITSMDASTIDNDPKLECIDIRGKYVIPGLIDMHVHGGCGISFGLGNLSAGLERYAKWVSAFGETGFVMSITGPDANFIEHIIKEYIELFARDYDGAMPFGIHLEGPFLNPEKHGAFNTKWIHNPDVQETRRYLKAGQNWIKHMSLAPELPHAMETAKVLKEAGVVASLGHSNTDYETAAAALAGNFSHVTHTFNAQSPLNHRQPGVVGAVLSSDLVTAELIADGMHVHPAAMKILVRCLGIERVVLITDAMPGAGMPDGEYDLVGQKVLVKNGKATLPDGTLGGSTATINQCVRNMVQLVGYPLKDAVRMASFNPAKVLGLDKQMGSLEPGKLANLAVIDKDVNVEMTFVKGKLVYTNETGE
jgi:N-acetylglucosamine-6-phosphate deacetylase